MELNAEQIKKALENWVKNYEGNVLDFTILCNAVALINSQEQRIKELTVELEAMRGAANSYKMHNEKLTEENEGMANICNANDALIAKLQKENKELIINMNAFGLTAKRLAEENERLRADNIELLNDFMDWLQDNEHINKSVEYRNELCEMFLNDRRLN